MSESPQAWLVLAGAHLRAAEYRLLAERFGDAAGIAAQPARVLRDAGLADTKADAIAQPDTALLDRSLEWLEADGHHVVTREDDTFPELLLQIPGSPLLLYLHGNPESLLMPALAIVGSRNPTRGGSRSAFDFAKFLSAAGFCIASGLAEGIDTAAHRGALAAGGPTVALLGTGIDRVYPAANHELAHEIAAAGALVSEYPLGARPERWHFPERNRLISGMSLGTLVVEAARQSGSLITARLSAEQGREVFAVPGSIHNPLARGCHRLIREGAKLVETGEDIVAELGPLAGHILQNSMESTRSEPCATHSGDDYADILEHLGHDPVSVDELATRSGLTIDQVSSMLLILELRGEVESLSGGRYALLT